MAYENPAKLVPPGGKQGPALCAAAREIFCGAAFGLRAACRVPVRRALCKPKSAAMVNKYLTYTVDFTQPVESVMGYFNLKPQTIITPPSAPPAGAARRRKIYRIQKAPAPARKTRTNKRRHRAKAHRASRKGKTRHKSKKPQKRLFCVINKKFCPQKYGAAFYKRQQRARPDFKPRAGGRPACGGFYLKEGTFCD